ncbi:hypothetical protein [Paraburkholderia guartelaensis]|uniref:hypothetical protein n=1 Tax=Paraburkholderia guartelaensis TaxID=2546446 RepID=UPI002AB77917|nr:hypothetical protein [Paraburkholderia guartelaensis]
MSTTLQSAVVLIFFCDLFGVTTEAGKRLKQSHNGLQTIFEEILEFFHRTLGIRQTPAWRAFWLSKHVQAMSQPRLQNRPKRISTRLSASNRTVTFAS